MPVQRSTIDVTATLIECFGERLTLDKDLEPDQRICTACKGLALVRQDQPFALREPGESQFGFPYHLEYVAHCPNCYMGIQTLCGHCGEPMHRGRLSCNCAAAQAERDAARRDKELERQKHCKRIALADYNEEMLYDDTTGDFRCFDGDDLEPDHTYFACKPQKDWLAPDADQVLETLSERAYEVCEDYELGYKPGFKEALEKSLNTWFAEYAELGTTYWADRTTIVVVPQENYDDEDEEYEADGVSFRASK